MLRYAIGIVLVIATSAIAAEPRPLAGPAIRELVAGATVEIDTPVGSKIPIQYAPHGAVAGEAPDLAFYLGAASDRGNWWISGDRLCQKWSTWFDAATHCLQLRQVGNLIHWQRDDGKTGTATIVRREPPPVEIATMTVMPVPPPAAAPASAPAVDKPAGRAVAAPAPRPSPVGAAPPAVPKPLGASAVPEPRTRVSAAPPMRLPHNLYAATNDPPRASATADASGHEPRGNQPYFRVAGVDPSDTLYIRRGPSADFAAIGAIPPEARGLQIIGPCRQEWCPITHRGIDGWVNRYYLAPERAARPSQRD